MLAKGFVEGGPDYQVAQAYQLMLFVDDGIKAFAKEVGGCCFLGVMKICQKTRGESLPAGIFRYLIPSENPYYLGTSEFFSANDLTSQQRQATLLQKQAETLGLGCPD